MQALIQGGVRDIVTLGTSIPNSLRSRKICQTFSDHPVSIYFTAGVHPHDAKTCNSETIQNLKSLSNDPVIPFLVFFFFSAPFYHFSNSSFFWCPFLRKWLLLVNAGLTLIGISVPSKFKNFGLKNRSSWQSSSKSHFTFMREKPLALS